MLPIHESPPPSWLSAHLAAPVLEAVTLKGALPLPEEAAQGGEGEAWLARGPRDAWVVSRSGDRARAVPLDRLDLRYEERLVGDLLHVGPHALGVPLGAGERVRGLLGRARLSRTLGLDVDEPGPVTARWGGPAEGLAAAWLRAWRQPDEVLLAWLPTRTAADLVDPWLPGHTTHWTWVVTGARCVLVGLSPLGALAHRDLPSTAAMVDGGGRVSVGEERWVVDKTHLSAARRIATLCGLERDARRREAARRLHVDGRGAQGLDLLDDLDPHPLDPLCRWVASGGGPELSADLQASIRALPGSGVDPVALVGWAESWSVPTPVGRAVLAVLRGEDSAYALPLHEVLHDMEAARRPAGRIDVEADLDLARHHVDVDRPGEVEALLAGHAARLPPDDLAHVLPPEAPDPSTGEGGAPRAREILQTLARARFLRGVPTVDLHQRLAQRAPLDPAALRALQQAGAGHLPDRAGRALAVLEGKLQGQVDAPATPQALEAAQVERLRHPVSRQDGALARLPGALARLQAPDAGALRDYCERLDPGRHPQAAAAVAEACKLLGLPPVPVFVSRGMRSVGLRANERPEPFLLVGGDHLEPESGYHLGPAELRFAVGSELTHLRFGHRRVGAEEVWAGLWDKGSTALSAAAGLLPLIDALKLPGRVLRAGVAGAGALGALKEVGGKLGLSAEAPPASADMGVESERLLAVARVLDLSADRAGLVLCADPEAAVRAMFRLHTRLRSELELVAQDGLGPVLRRLDASGQPVLPHLALRVGALLAFWLDDEYTELAAAARPRA